MRIFGRGITFHILMLGLVVALTSPRPVAACLNGRDTARIEKSWLANGVPKEIEIISGLFERNPPLYFEMRVERLLAVAASPGLTANEYDDLIVAYDRLGKPDEAVAWAEKKLAYMKEQQALGEYKARERITSNDWYRYYANHGTVLAHRWIKNGGPRDDLSDLRAGREMIAKGIDINPEAHFGRERYQLQAMDWLLSLDEFPVAADMAYLPDMLGIVGRDGARPDAGKFGSADWSEARTALIGLIVMGAAWESVDVHLAIARSLEVEGKGDEASLVYLRVQRLISDGKRSLVSDRLSQGELARMTASFRSRNRANSVPASFQKRLDSRTKKWNETRLSFLEAKLQRGLHPDTHADFWNGYQEFDVESIKLKTSGFEKFMNGPGVYVVAFLFWFVLLPYVVAKSLRIGGGFLKRFFAPHSRQS